MKTECKLEKHLIEKNIKNVIILCRGKSVEKIENFEGNSRGNFCIFFVNKFKELKKNKVLALKIKEKNSSFNVQFINNDHVNIEDKNTLDFFNIKCIQSNKKRTDPDAPKDLKSLEKNINYSEILYIDESTKDSDYKLKSNGMSCLGYVSTFSEIENIHIFGLDFFECDYFSHHVHTGDKSVRGYQPQKGKVAKNQFRELVDKNKNINYHIYTYAEFESVDVDNFFIY